MSGKVYLSPTCETKRVGGVGGAPSFACLQRPTRSTAPPLRLAPTVLINRWKHKNRNQIANVSFSSGVLVKSNQQRREEKEWSKNKDFSACFRPTGGGGVSWRVFFFG